MVTATLHGIVPTGFGKPDSKEHTLANRWPTHKAAMWSIQETVEFLGIRRGHLARLIGVPKDHVYKWAKGEMRPSALYVTRMMLMQSLRRQGLSFVKMSYIDWEKAEVHWRGECPCGVRHWRAKIEPL